MKILNIQIFGFMILLLAACTTGYEPVSYGKEACAHCRMTIIDNRYAAEMITQKGKVFKFDDLICMKQFLYEQPQEGKTILYIEDYLRKTEGAIDATTAVYLQSELFATPMNGNYAAFASEADAKPLSDSLKIRVSKWEDID